MQLVVRAIVIYILQFYYTLILRKVAVFNYEISKEIPPLSSLPETLDENQVMMLLSQLDSLNV